MFKIEYILNAIPVDNMIAICHIIDEYPIFNENLKKFVKSRNNLNDIYNLWKISNGENVIGARKVKNFYQDNKSTIDTINKFTYINNYIFRIYDSKGNLKDNSNIDIFYDYLIKHRDNIDKNILVLDKISKLGFRNIYFDEKLDFSNNIYTINIKGDNKEIIYLDNMAALPKYHVDSIEYKTNNSNYSIFLQIFKRSNLYNQYILVNSLLFDPNRLPNEISKEGIFNRILTLKENQKEFKTITKEQPLEEKKKTSRLIRKRV